MDFFGAQHQARRKTGWLVGLFMLAVVGIILTVYVTLVLVLQAADTGIELWEPTLFALIAGGTLLIVTCGGLLRRLQLRAGGPAVAQMLGGRRVQPSTTDHHEKVLHNVVEEMAIASGVPIPQVYVMDGEQGINAFAAGNGTGDAVVAVTRGTLELLSRDELQGVVGHEFSHILNADMRLNMRLMATLFGITCIATAGYIVMRTAGRGSSGGSKKGGGAAQIFVIGLVLYLVGSLGRFFASMIKASVSRQREFLADAAAVQFTRNPRGIAGALHKIGGGAESSRVQHAQASEAAHMFFSEALSRKFSGWFATHPPIATRIAAIEPLFSRYPEEKAARPSPAAPQAPTGKRAAGGAPGGMVLPGGLDPRAILALQPDAIMASIGTVDDQRLAAAQAWLAKLPESIRRATGDPFGASALVYGLLLDRDAEVRARQLQLLAQNTDASTHAETLGLVPAMLAVQVDSRLPLLDLALPALRSMSREQHARFDANVRGLIAADQQVTVFEFALSRVLRRHLASAFAPPRTPRVEHVTLLPVLAECAVVLGALAWSGGEADAAEAFVAGIDTLPRAPGADADAPRLPARDACGVTAVEKSLERLAVLAPRAKAQLMRAAATVVAHDGKTGIGEFELLRALADSIDVPVPPLALSA